MIHSTSKTNWYELDLEYAPIESISNLNIKNHYVYDLSIEDYILLSDYRQKIKNLNELNIILQKILPFYNRYLDIYYSNDLIPLELNDILFLIKYKYVDKYNNKILLKFPTPYGYLNYYHRFENSPYQNITTEVNNTFQIFNISTNEIEEYLFSDFNNRQNDLENLIYYGYELLPFI
jgi:hypothetical protein